MNMYSCTCLDGNCNNCLDGSQTMCFFRVMRLAQAEAVRDFNTKKKFDMDNLLDLVKRIKAEAYPRDDISGLTFPENLWHRIKQMLEHFSVKDSAVCGSYFMGLAVQTSKIIPENQIVIMKGGIPAGLITLSEDGSASVKMFQVPPPPPHPPPPRIIREGVSITSLKTKK